MTLGTGWRRVRLIFLSTILVALIAYTGCDFWAGRRLALEVEKFEARYGSLSNAPIARKVPAPENRARLVNAAAALVNNNPTVRDRAEITRLMSDPSASTLTPSLKAYVDSNTEAIRLALQFVTRPESSFEVDYRSLSGQPNFLDMRTLSNVLFLATLQAIEAGHADEAAALITAGISMSAAGRHEPSLIAQLIRISIADIPAGALQRLMESGDPSKAALAQMASVLAENREPAPSTVGLLGEVRHFHYAFSQPLAGQPVDMAAFSLPWRLPSPFSRLARPLLRWAHARYLEEMGRLLEIQLGPRPIPARPEPPNPPIWAVVDRWSQTFTIGLRRTIETNEDFTRTQAAAELVVALRRHKLDHGTYPDDLSALVPAYLPAVPIDPGTGKPPVYKRDGEGFTLTTSPSISYAPTKRPTAVWKIQK